MRKSKRGWKNDGLEKWIEEGSCVALASGFAFALHFTRLNII